MLKFGSIDVRRIKKRSSKFFGHIKREMLAHPSVWFEFSAMYLRVWVYYGIQTDRQSIVHLMESGY